jgi:hypothetical protein
MARGVCWQLAPPWALSPTLRSGWRRRGLSRLPSSDQARAGKWKPIDVLHVELLGRGPEARGLGAAGPLSAMDWRAAMTDYDFKDQKEELERRLAAARRVAALPVDPLTKERVDGFIQELEVELGRGSAEMGRWQT